MEEELFSWEGCDIDDTASFQFYNCRLKVAIGPAKIGDLIDCISIDYSDGVLEIYNEVGTEVIHTQKLKLTLIESDNN